jgi:hypothetical protein
MNYIQIIFIGLSHINFKRLIKILIFCKILWDYKSVKYIGIPITYGLWKEETLKLTSKTSAPASIDY